LILKTRSCAKALANGLFYFLIVGCSSVPNEAVELASLVGERIVDVRKAHILSVKNNFASTEERINTFMDEKWVPHYLGNFVKEANLTDEINKAVPFNSEEIAALRGELALLSIEAAGEDEIVDAVSRAFGDAERGQIVLEFAAAAMQNINAQRDELLAPVQKREKEVLNELEAIYFDLIKMQNAVTAHIQSAAEVESAQDDILERLGLLQKRDEIVEDALALNEKLEGAIKRGNEVDSVVKQLEELAK